MNIFLLMQIVGVDPLGSTLALPEKLNETNVSYYEVRFLGGMPHVRTGVCC